ncbi:hypothetical protein EJD97_009290, partial [Solanum chilense]
MNKSQEVIPQQSQPAITIQRNTGSNDKFHSSQYKHQAGTSFEFFEKQGIAQGIPIPPNSNVNSDVHIHDVERLDREVVRNQNYNSNFPKISTNFERNNYRNETVRNDLPTRNNDNFNKKDQEPAPYTVIQTYADRLRFNQYKRHVSIQLTEPEITTKQGLPAVLYVKEEVVNNLAATCRFTLIGKFIYTMPRVELIRKNFILQTQLSGGV